MDHTIDDLLTKERRRQRAMVAVVLAGVSLVVISSRSERAMFQSGTGIPGVFATLKESGTGMPRVSLREGSPAAFFAGLGRFGKPAEPGNGRVIPAESLEQIGPGDALLFAGPDADLPLEPGFLSNPLFTDVPPPAGTISLPELGNPGTRRIFSDTGGGSSGDGGSSSGGTTSGGDTGSSGGGGSSSGGTTSGGDTSSSSGGGGSSSGGTSSGGDGPGTPSAVPEPSSWLLMIGGFLSIGMAMRIRRKRSNAAPTVSA